MPQLNNPTATWLDDLKSKGSLSDEEFTSLKAVFDKPEVSEFVKGSVLRQQDYSRQMNQTQAEYKKKLGEIEKYEQDLADWKGKSEASIAQTQAKLQATERRAEQLRQVAIGYGIDESELASQVPAQEPLTPLPKQTPVNEDLSKDYLPRKEFTEVVASYPIIIGEVNDIISEHMDLFGKQPKGMRGVVEQAMREGRTIREVYEETFSVQERRQQLDKESREAEIKRRVDEEVQKFRTENSLPIPRPQAQRGAVFSNPIEMPKDDFSETQSRVDSVSAAVKHWQSLEQGQ